MSPLFTLDAAVPALAHPAVLAVPNDFLLGVRMSDAYEGEDLGAAQVIRLNEVGVHATWLLVTHRRMYVLLQDLRLLLPHVIHGEDHGALRGEALPVQLVERGETTFLKLPRSGRTFVTNTRVADAHELEAALAVLVEIVRATQPAEDTEPRRLSTPFARALDPVR